MGVNERAGLIARIRHLRRVAAARDPAPASTTSGAAAPGAPSSTSSADPGAEGALEARVAHLEQLLQGLQDSVYRDSERQDKRLAALEAQIQPAALGAALSRDARMRGL